MTFSHSAIFCCSPSIFQYYYYYYYYYTHVINVYARKIDTRLANRIFSIRLLLFLSVIYKLSFLCNNVPAVYIPFPVL